MAEKSIITLDSEVECSKAQVSCDVADEVVILSLSTGEYYGLNPIAARIWTLLQAPCSVAGIRDALLGEYDDVTPDDCTAQVIALLEEMAAIELIVVR